MPIIFLKTMYASRTAALFLRNPLPGYIYKISWDLPETESDEGGHPPADADHAKGLIASFQELGSGEPLRAMEECLENFRAEISTWPSESGERVKQKVSDSVNAALFVYDTEAGALRLVAGSSGVKAELEDAAIKNGRTIVGQAYRRRHAVFSTQPEKEPFFDPQSDPAVLHQNQRVCFAIPLNHPMVLDQHQAAAQKREKAPGLRVAVFWMGATLNFSPLSRYASEEIGRGVLIEHVAAWFQNTLREALNLPSPS